MAKVKQSTSSNPTRKIRPAISPEARENQLIALAVDLVEQRLLNGTASSQETTHFLKLGSTKARYELEKMKAENDLIKAKTKAYESAEDIAEKYEKAIQAMRHYSGNSDANDY